MRFKEGTTRVEGARLLPFWLLSARLRPFTLALGALLAVAEVYRARVAARQVDADKRIYPGAPLPPARAGDGGAQRPAPLSVYSSWLGGVPGFLAGGWQLGARRSTLKELKTRELNYGRWDGHVR